jgi:hypothetical protein
MFWRVNGAPIFSKGAPILGRWRRIREVRQRPASPTPPRPHTLVSLPFSPPISTTPSACRCQHDPNGGA